MRSFLSALLLVAVLALAGCDSDGLSEFNRDCEVNCDGDGDDGGAQDDDGGEDGDDQDGDGDGDDDADGVLLLLDPTATYLRTEGGDALDAPAVPLGDLGLVAGESACFLMKGDVDLGEGFTSADLGVPGVLAVFSRTGELLGATEPERVEGAQDAGDDVTTPLTNPSDLPTDIGQDFDATDACVVVPDEAEFVFFSPFDAYFFDNAAVGVYGVEVLRH